MGRSAVIRRRLIPGTTGWTADDLDDPRIAAAWEEGRFQIFEGVLAVVPPAYFDNSEALARLASFINEYLRSKGIEEVIAFEVDLELGDVRVPRADAVYMSKQDKRRQLDRRRPRTPGKLKYGRLRVPPTLVIENISKGHESEDRVVKRRYYEEARIPNYWILDTYDRSLECLVLERGKYALDQIGRGKARVSPSCFSGLVIDLAKVWG